jgi:hypothetical protein
MDSTPDQPIPVIRNRKGLAVASLILGMIGTLGLCLAWIPFFNMVGLIVTPSGLILGILGLKSSKKWFAIAGIVLCSITLLVGIVTIVIVGIDVLLGSGIGNVIPEMNSTLVSP